MLHLQALCVFYRINVQLKLLESFWLIVHFVYCTLVPDPDVQSLIIKHEAYVKKLGLIEINVTFRVFGHIAVSLHKTAALSGLLFKI